MVAAQNHSSVPLHLEEGQALGSVTPVEVSEEMTTIGAVQLKGREQGPDKPLRLEALLKGTDWEQPHLGEGELGQLRALLSDYVDVFALMPPNWGDGSCTAPD